MSLSLLQSYSSAEEEEGGNGELGDPQYQNSSDDEENCAVLKNPSYKPLFDPNPPPSSTLPSAFDAFSEVNTRNYELVMLFIIFLLVGICLILLIFCGKSFCRL